MKKALLVLRRLDSDEQGAVGLEILLIIAALVLPLLGALIIFRQELGSWVRGVWDTVRGEAEQEVLP